MKLSHAIAFVVIGCSLVGANLANAQPMPTQDQPLMVSQGPQQESAENRMIRELKLTPEQTAQVKQIFAEGESVRWKHQAKNKKDYEAIFTKAQLKEMHRTRQQPQISEKQRQQIAELRERQEATTRKHKEAIRAKIRPLLTKKQQAIFDKTSF